MKRIEQCFADLKAKNKTALITFITAGDPKPDMTVNIMHKLVESGADIIELGVPFSDPMADGPVIQRASERALEHGVTLANVIDMVAEFRKQDTNTPIVLMGYLNPVEVMGYSEYAKSAKAAGVDGTLLVDAPPEESGPLVEAFNQYELDQVFLLAPTTNAKRIKKICDKASGFVYYVSLKGVTGSSELDTDSVKEKLSEIRKHTDLPVGVGFGIKDVNSARKIGMISDAIIIGSALVDRVARLQTDEKALETELSGFISEIRRALDEQLEKGAA